MKRNVQSPRQVKIIIQGLIDEMERAGLTTITVADLRRVVDACERAMKR